MWVKLKTYDGQEFEQKIEGFNLDSFIAEVNSTQGGMMLKFGDVGLTKSLIQVVDTRQGAHDFDTDS